MKDLIRSPLQTVHPMTDEEWQDLVLRASRREIQRAKRRRPQRKLVRLAQSLRRGCQERMLNQVDSSGLR